MSTLKFSTAKRISVPSLAARFSSCASSWRPPSRSWLDPSSRTETFQLHSYSIPGRLRLLPKSRAAELLEIEVEQSLPLPLIDLSLAREKAASSLREACIQHGFFIITNHGVAEDLIAQQFAESRLFFSLPEEKKLNILSDKNSRGYSPFGEQKLDPANQRRGDTKESIYLWGEKQSPEAGHPDCDKPFHGPNQWPADDWGVPSFKPTMQAYILAMERVMTRVNELLALALHLPVDYFEDKFDRALLTLRPIHYTNEMSEPGDGLFAAGAHTDWAHITFLITDGTPGLQMLYNGVWRDVPHVPGAFVCNIGDMTERWSNGLFRSTMHRVVNRVGRERYSCAFFSAPNYDTMVECLPTCRDVGREPLPPVSCADYLMGKYAQTHAQFAAHNPGAAS